MPRYWFGKKIVAYHNHVAKIGFIVQIQYFKKRTLFLAETFMISLQSLDLSRRQNSAQKSIVWFRGGYLKISRNISKMVITRLQRAIGRNTFRLLLVSPKSVYGHPMNPNGECHLEWFSRQWSLTFLGYQIIRLEKFRIMLIIFCGTHIYIRRT